MSYVYNASTNTGGWGAPNPVIGDATAATLEVFLPDPATGLPKATSEATIDVFPTLPNTTGVLFNITNVDLGLVATFVLPDGIYRFIYDVTTTGPVTNLTDCQKYLDGKALTFFDKLSGRLDIDGCDCGGLVGDLTSERIMHERALWQAARDAATCGKAAKAAKIINHIDEFFICFFGSDYTKN